MQEYNIYIQKAVMNFLDFLRMLYTFANKDIK